MDLKTIKAMLKVIPNNIPVCLEDLEEISEYEQREINKINCKRNIN